MGFGDHQVAAGLQRPHVFCVLQVLKHQHPDSHLHRVSVRRFEAFGLFSVAAEDGPWLRYTSIFFPRHSVLVRCERGRGNCFQGALGGTSGTVPGEMWWLFTPSVALDRTMLGAFPREAQRPTVTGARGSPAGGSGVSAHLDGLESRRGSGLAAPHGVKLTPQSYMQMHQ